MSAVVRSIEGKTVDCMEVLNHSELFKLVIIKKETGSQCKDAKLGGMCSLLLVIVDYYGSRLML